MTGDERAASLYREATRLDIRCLVMGGHAVRFYGVERSTIDYDFHVAVDDATWASLRDLLARSAALGPHLVEGASWRPDDFRRFVIGTLPDGREERLELWRRNHLLAPFPDLWRRRVEGTYGGATVAFLGIDDLIKSKETERADDWRDVELLEEIADEQRLGRIHDEASTIGALAHLRSRKGFERAMDLCRTSAVAAAAMQVAVHPVTVAYLAPFSLGSALPPAPPPNIGAILAGPLAAAAPGSARHLALVEAVRRLARSAAMAADRADKERIARERP